MTRWTWVDPQVVEAMHEEQLAEHGGPLGVRDRGAVEPAMARPINLAAYGEPDIASLAASYAFGLARNHGFVDGHKRTAWSVASLFLELNDVTLGFEDDDAITTFIALAAGDVTEDELANWYRKRIIFR